MIDAKRLEIIEAVVTKGMANGFVFDDYAVQDVRDLIAEVKKLRVALGQAREVYCHHTCPADDGHQPFAHEALCQDFKALISG